MPRKYFGTDGIRGSANTHPMTSEVALKVGMAAGKLFTNGSYRHRVVIGKDTRLSGYMIEFRARLRLYRGGHGCVPARSDADAGRRHADPLAPRRSRRDDLSLAQPVHRQRHQAVWSGRLQALRRQGTGNRAADGGRVLGAVGGGGADRPGHPYRQRARALYRIRQAYAAEEHPLRRHQGGNRLRQRRGLQSGARGAVGARCRGHQDRGRAQRLEHQQGLRLDRARGFDPQGQRGARRYRHRARRRRRPGGDCRREGPHHRRRPADGGHRRVPGRSVDGSPAAASSPR